MIFGRFSPLLSSIFLALTLTSVIDVARALVDPIATSNCTDITPPSSLGCTSTDGVTFTATYPDGEIECESLMTLQQAGKEPTVSLEFETQDAANAAESDYFTLLLVDFGESDFHPIIHYGAANIPGSNFVAPNQLILSDASPFSSYRGPSPPAFIPGVQLGQFNYDWIVAKQESFVDDPPAVVGTINFSYQDFLTGVNGTVLSTMYFSSGFCVYEIDDSTPSPTPSPSLSSLSPVGSPSGDDDPTSSGTMVRFSNRAGAFISASILAAALVVG